MRLHRLAVVFLLGAAATIVLVYSLSTLASVRSTQIDGTPTGKRIEKLAEQVNSCLNPDGSCYKASQQQRGSTLGTIDQGNRVNAAAAAACAARPDVHGYVAILACMNAVLAANEHPTP